LSLSVPPMNEVTRILSALEQGGPHAAEQCGSRTGLTWISGLGWAAITPCNSLHCPAYFFP
jgi:hypothetical protein